MTMIQASSGARYSFFTALFVTALVLILFSVSIVSRDIRLAAALLCAAIACANPTMLWAFFRTPVGGAMALLPLLAVAVFLLQNLLDLAQSNELAVRQIAYYGLFPLSAAALTGLIIRFSSLAFNLFTTLLIALSSFLISINIDDNWLYGSNVIRGNLENTTVYILVFLIVFCAKSHIFLLFVTILYLGFSFLTNSAQGVLLSGLFFVFLVLPTVSLKRLMLVSIAALPFLLPVIVILADDAVSHIDQNVDFRRMVWLQIYQDFALGDLAVGRLGSTVNHEFFDRLVRSGTAWEGADNIGAHNFPLQMVQLFGIAGLMASIVFVVALLRMALPLVNYPGIAFCFLALTVSLALNQAESHLLYQFGTALLIACISATYMSAAAVQDRA